MSGEHPTITLEYLAEIDDATARMHLDKAEQRSGPDIAKMFDLSPDHLDASKPPLLL
jgi:hypothetical protein